MAARKRKSSAEAAEATAELVAAAVSDFVETKRAVAPATHPAGNAGREGALAALRKKFGDNVVQSSTGEEPPPIPVVSTGSLRIDAAIGVGGLPYGRIVEISGMESSGKTTLALSVVAQAQAKGDLCGYVDAEHALDMLNVRNIGVREEDLLLAQPGSGEEALQIVETMIENGVRVVVVDSVAALIPQVEIDGQIGDVQVGLQARLMSGALRKLTALASRKDALLVFINQLRDKIGVTGFGEKTTTAGGHALRFYSSVRLRITRIGSIKEGDAIIGNKVLVKVVKNKVAPPFRVAETELHFGFPDYGFSPYPEVLDAAVATGLIRKAGAWFKKPDGTSVGQGRAATILWLRDNAEEYAELLVAARSHYHATRSGQEQGD